MTSAPATVGNYELVAVLGEGGMGVVYEARHLSMGRRAAVKLLRSELAHNEEAVRRFFNEARAANAIRHPGIVQIYDCGITADGTPWLIMELLEGETLAARLARVEKLQVEDAVDICIQATSALGAAHAQGIVHRDLKPDNIYLVRDQGMARGERVKVLDFGIAKLGAASAAAVRMTRTGTVMGTPMYMSPEQCRGTKEADARSDVYSLGLILYEALAGSPPFVSQGMGELFQMHMTVPPPRLEERAPSVGLRLAGTVHKMIEKDPAHRFQSMDELARALRAGESLVPMVSAPAPAPASVSVPPVPAPVVPTIPDASGTWRSESGRTRLLPESGTHGSAKGKTTLSASTAEMIPRKRKGSAPRFAMFGALVLAGAAAILLVSMRGRTPGPEASSLPPEPVMPAAAATAAEPAPVTPEPAPPEPAPPAPVPPAPESDPGHAAPAGTVVIDIATNPPGARVVDARDGSLLGMTPLRREIGKESGTLELRIDKRGFAPRTVTVPLDRGFEGMLRLSKVPAPPEREKIIKL